jgi:hypothetical protein
MVLRKVHLLYEPGNVIHCVAEFAEETSCVSIVTCITIARQRLGKHVPAVNTPQQ